MIARLATVALLLLAGCATSGPVEKKKPDPTRETAYGDAVEQLTAINLKAADLWKRGKSDEAAAAITSGQPVQARLLAAPQPTLAAMEAASDLDELYARMLQSNGHEGWARMLFQKNVVRWKAWRPQTAATERRLREAQQAVAECDRRLNHSAH